MSLSENHVTLVGAGLAGSLLAVFLARRGIRVEVFERFADQRRAPVPAGRSINLALAERGRRPLARAGLLEGVDAFALPMAGRMLHEPGREPLLQRYGQREEEVIYSVHRARLNTYLLDAAESAGARIHFDRRLESVDFGNRKALFTDSEGGRHDHDFQVLLGTDGAGSALRQAMDAVAPTGAREEPLDHGYKEFTMPPKPDGSHAMDPGALHIWPRGGFMMIALPNPDGSFTCTLFLARAADAGRGEPGFDQLADWPAQSAFMEQHFADTLPLLPDVRREFADNPVGFLGTLRLDRWHLDNRALVLGDAAHAIVPFHGQGMNAAFEDVACLDALIEELGTDWGRVFERFEALRKPNANAIADLALKNYEEMRAGVRDPRFHLKKSLEWELERRMPGHFIPGYAMVMFHTLPYSEALERSRIQSSILEAATREAVDLAEVDVESAMERVRADLDPVSEP